MLTRSYGTQTTSNSIERYVWDGSDLLWEMHYPGAAGTADSVLELDTLAMMTKLSCEEVHPHDCGWDYGDTLFMQLPDSTPYVGGIGRIVYMHGAQMDQPMSMIRFGYASDSVLIPPFAVMPHHDYRGLPDIGTYSSGNTSYTYFGLPVNIDYFAPQSTLHMQRMTSSIPHGWFGGLLSQQQTPAGDMYMRNRYYDPMQGRFTQEDPIGLAGGMNLYGFARGDPVNFSDPFGLCPPEDQNYSTCKRGTKEWKEGANRTQSAVSHTDVGGVVAFSGSSAAFAIPFLHVGFTISYGTYNDAHGRGHYATVGKTRGMGYSYGLEFGQASSKDALNGRSSGGCIGYLVSGLCFATNSSGLSWSTSAAGGSKAGVWSEETETILGPQIPDKP